MNGNGSGTQEGQMTRGSPNIRVKPAIVGGILAVGAVLLVNSWVMTASAQDSASKPPSASASSYFTATADAATGNVHIDSVSAGAKVRPSTSAKNSGVHLELVSPVVQWRRDHPFLHQAAQARPEVGHQGRRRKLGRDAEFPGQQGRGDDRRDYAGQELRHPRR